LSETSFRPAAENDFQALTEIWFRAVKATHLFLTEEQLEGYRARLPVEFLPNVPELLVAEVDERPVGFIGMSGTEIDMLFVDPARHGQGIGRQLVDLAADGRTGLTVDVNEQNPSGHGFYLHLGFRETGRSATDPDGNPFPLIHLTRGEPAAG